MYQIDHVSVDLDLLKDWSENKPGRREVILDFLHDSGPHITALFLVAGLQDRRIDGRKAEHNVIVNGLMDRFIADRDA